MATRAGVYWFTTLLLSGAPRFTSQRFLVADEYAERISVHRRVLSEMVVYVVHCAGTAWPAPKVKQLARASIHSACMIDAGSGRRQLAVLGPFHFSPLQSTVS